MIYIWQKNLTSVAGKDTHLTEVKYKVMAYFGVHYWLHGLYGKRYSISHEVLKDTNQHHTIY